MGKIQDKKARNAKPRLLYAIKSLDLTAGGAEKVLASITSGMVEKGYDVTILTFDQPESSSFYPLHHKIKRINLGIGDTARKTTIFETIARIKALRKTIKKEKPDTVIAFMHSMFVPMALALVGTGIPLIASEHTVPEHYRGKVFEFFMFLFSIIFIRKITVLSDDVKALYPPLIRSRMYVMPNPIDAGPASAAQASDMQKGNKPARNIILNVGRLDVKKDQRTLIQAFAAIAKDYPDWDLRIIGEGPMRKELEMLVEVLEMQARVFIPGNKKNIEEEYKAAQFFVTASQYESLGMSTIEALSHGLPAIGFQDCPGTNKIIQNRENGLLISSQNRILSLAQAMKDLIADESLRNKLSENAAQSIEHYKSDNVYRNWEKLIRYVNLHKVNLNSFFPNTGKRRNKDKRLM